MSTDLEQQLRAALREDAQRARLVNPDGPPAPAARELSSVENRRRSLSALVAAAAAIILLAVAAALTQFDDDQDLDTVPPVTDAPVTETTVTETTIADLPLDDAQVFTDIPPGSTVELPPAPISPRNIPAVVWTGTELIVWSGMDVGLATLDDGGVFAPATGAWRVIAPAPIEPRLGATAAWTGTEMVVWGGGTQYSSGANLLDGAAYNPTSDTWRLLPEGPFDSWETGATGVWAGDELIVYGLEVDQAGERYPMAGYDPATNEWRRIADAPPGFDGDLLWTGEALLSPVTGSYSNSTGEFGPGQVMRYDPQSDVWHPVAELTTDDVSLIAVPDADGVARRVLALAHEIGTPMILLDASGNVIGTMPGIPADAATVGDRHASGGVAVGDEVLFWIRSFESFESQQPPERWALNLDTATWRPLEADDGPPVYFDLHQVPEAGVLIGWSEVAEPDGPSTGIVYRPPTSAGD